MLFENERFDISRIVNVVQYAPNGHTQYMYPGKLPTYELMYYETGNTTVRFADRTFHMSAGSVLYLPKGLDNEQYSVTVHEEFSLYNIYFDTESPLPSEPIQITTENDEFKNLYEKVYRLWIGKRFGYYYKTMQQAYHIIETLRRAQLRYASDNKPHHFTAVEDYMAEHYCDPDFDYGELARCSGLSYSYFKKLFIQKYGYPPVKYVTLLRINRACELLHTKQFRIHEIAQLCGFENVYYFSSVFKKQLGVSPTRYMM